MSFTEAQSAFYDEHAIRYDDPDHAGDSVIRIMSARKANAVEERAYAAHGGNP